MGSYLQAQMNLNPQSTPQVEQKKVDIMCIE